VTKEITAQPSEIWMAIYLAKIAHSLLLHINFDEEMKEKACSHDSLVWLSSA